MESQVCSTGPLPSPRTSGHSAFRATFGYLRQFCASLLWSHSVGGRRRRRGAQKGILRRAPALQGAFIGETEPRLQSGPLDSAWCRILEVSLSPKAEEGETKLALPGTTQVPAFQPRQEQGPVRGTGRSPFSLLSSFPSCNTCDSRCCSVRVIISS